MGLFPGRDDSWCEIQEVQFLRPGGPSIQSTIRAWYLFDLDSDHDVDLHEVALFENAFTGE